MPTIVKFVVYFAVLFGLLLIAGWVPRSEREFHGLVSFLVVAWFFGGVLIVFRTIYRFITR